MKLLLDEQLSPRLVGHCSALGILAAHVAHIGKAGWSDQQLHRFAIDNDFIVVTINAADFLALAANADLHCGLIVLRAHSLRFEQQWAWLEAALRYADAHCGGLGGLINRVVEVHAIDRINSRELSSIVAASLSP